MFLGFLNAHVLHMLYSIAFPLRANRFMTSDSAKRRVHCIEVFVVVILGLLGSTKNISLTGYQFIGFPYIFNPVHASLESQHAYGFLKRADVGMFVYVDVVSAIPKASSMI